MEFFRIRRTIPFMRYSLILNAISFISFGIAVVFLITRGLNLSVDFTGGTVIEVSYPQAANLEQIRGAIEQKGWGEFQVQNFGTSRDVLIRLPLEKGSTSGQQAERVMQTLKAQESAVELKRVEFVGPAVGEELAHDGALALLLVVIGIMVYLAFRFEWKFSVAAIVANLHDVVLVVGMFAIFRWEFSLPVLAAVLAVLGYSVNESVIIFDRVREHFKKFRKMTTVEVIDSAITATISRTIITHGCTLAMTLAMYFLRRPRAALLRAGADDRHRLRHLLLGLRRGRDRDVPRRQTRRPRQAGEEGRRAAGPALTERWAGAADMRLGSGDAARPLRATRQLGRLADIGARGQRQQLLARFGRHLERADEFLQRLARDALAARQFLQLLVRILDAVAAHHRLHRLGQHFPGVVQVCLQARRVDFQLVQAAQAGLDADQRVAEGHADIAQHRRIGQVALPARDRQLVGEVAQHRVGEARDCLRSSRSRSD